MIYTGKNPLKCGGEIIAPGSEIPKKWAKKNPESIESFIKRGLIDGKSPVSEKLEVSEDLILRVKEIEKREKAVEEWAKSVEEIELSVEEREQAVSELEKAIEEREKAVEERVKEIEAIEKPVEQEISE
jgi:hypothetical protein